MKVCITVDVEHDCPPYLTTYRGIEAGMPVLLDLLAKEQIPATLFTTGDVARRYPEIMRRVVAEGHELGCHGDTHRNFDTMTRVEAQQEIETASETLRQFGSVTSFRAPYLQFPVHYVDLLADAGYSLDSSLAKYKPAFLAEGTLRHPHICRIPASITSSALRLPTAVWQLILGWLESPIVLFVHPWEFVDWRATNLRWDCRFRTGEAARACLARTIVYLKQREATFLRMRTLLD